MQWSESTYVQSLFFKWLYDGHASISIEFDLNVYRNVDFNSKLFTLLVNMDLVRVSTYLFN